MITIPSLEDKTLIVVGLGASGMSAARCLRASNAHVWVWDDDESRQKEAKIQGFVLLNPNALPESDTIRALILSPGIPHDLPFSHPMATWAKTHSIPIWCDVELFALALRDHKFNGKVFGVTGTNGKSTTTALLTHLFRHAGFDAHMGGNIGIPVLNLPFYFSSKTYYVLELSSFQLQRIFRLYLDGAILLNVTPDHLDRHGTLENYTCVKESIFAHLKTGGIWVCYPKPFEGDISSRLFGHHNRQNMAAALEIWRGLSLDEAVFWEGCALFSPLPHRLEEVGQMGHVRYINDSKATNGQAAFRALDAFDRIYWIVGGAPKEGGLDGVDPFYPKIVKAYTVGAAADSFFNALKPFVPVQNAGDIKTALLHATKDAARDPLPSVVVLSPAAASYDQFRNFEHRGDCFREWVYGLCKGEDIS